MVMERPSYLIIPTLGFRFPDIVKEGSPTKPEGSLLTLGFADIVQDLQRVIEIILVGTAVTGFHQVEFTKFGKKLLEQSRIIKFVDATAGLIGHQNLVEFLLYTLTTDNLQPMGITGQGIAGLTLNVKLQLSRKPDSTEHS